jgi:hypothetical protein
MKDSKLKSEDLIKIRQGLGGDAKATTQTARLARKVAEKTKKRNKVTVALIPKKDPNLSRTHDFLIKKGGIPRAGGDLVYNSFRKESITGAPSIGIVDVGSIATTDRAGNTQGFDWDAHNKHAGKTLSSKDVRAALTEVKKKLPGAYAVIGHRDTGVKADSDMVQHLKLPSAKPGLSRLEKAVRSNSTRLRGAMRGVEMLPPKLGKALARGPAGAITAPLEAGFTAYASGGGATGAATAAAATTGAGAGITAAMKRVGTLAAKHAPGLARVAGKAAVPLAVASAGYDLFRTVNEGYKAHEAATDARRNEAYMNDNYGSIEAATATRHRRQRERERTN